MVDISAGCKYGVATGNVIVLDVDPRHGGDHSLRQLEDRHGPLPLTWRAFTGGGGEHVYFRAPEGVEIRNNAGRLGPGLDVRGVGGYVVAPPSIHISGNQYVWNVDHHPDEVPLAALPEFLTATAPINQATPPREWEDFVTSYIGEGGRNQAITRLAGHLLRRYVDPHITLELCRLWNQSHCYPQLPRDEVIITVNSICRRELARRKAAT